MKRLLPAAIPYAAVLIGMYALRNIWLTMGLYHLGILAFMLLRPNGPGRAALLRGWRTGLGLVLGAVCVLSGVTIYFAFPLAAATGAAPADASASSAVSGLAGSLADFGVRGAGFWLLFGWYVAITPWIEELFWRGRLSAGRLGTGRRGLDASDILFAGYHVLVLLKFLQWPWTVLAFVSLAAVAWAWRWAMRATGGLAIPVVTHAVADISTMIAVYLLMA